MADKKEPEPKVQFSDPKSKQSARKTKVHFIGALTLLLLLGIVVSLAVYLTLRKTPQSDFLTEPNLQEGDTLTYQVDQDIEVKHGNGTTLQKGTIRVMVGLRVHNKTSEEYWFLVKFNLFSVSGDVDLSDEKTTTSYFLVRLKLQSSAPNQAAGELIEVHGDNSTADKERLRFVFGILHQLLPNVKRDLYENVDGKKVTQSNPEESALLPVPVKMHREVNTSDKDAVVIKNSFNSSDVVGMASDNDTDFKYSDHAYIKKSTGMVTEGLAYLSEQLNLGGEGGADPNMIKITVKSHVTLVETVYFGHSEHQAANLHLFVKLTLPKSDDPAVLSVNETESQVPFNISSLTKEQDPKNLQTTPLDRSRRSVSYNADQANASLIAEIWERIGPVCLNFKRTFKVYEKWLNYGIRVRAIASVSVNIDEISAPQIEFKLELFIGRRYRYFFFSSSTPVPVFQKNYTIPLQNLTDLHVQLPEQDITIDRSFLPYFTVLRLRIRVSFWISLPLEGNSLYPLKLNITIKPVAEVTARIERRLWLYFYRPRLVVESILSRVALPLSLSFCNDTLCANLSVKLSKRICLCRYVLGRIGFRWFWFRKCWCVGSKPFVRRLVQVCNVTKTVTSSSSSLVLSTTSSSLSVSMSSTISTTTSPVPTTSSVPTVSTASTAPSESTAPTVLMSTTSSTAPTVSIAPTPSIGTVSSSL